jgi:hypothetical protein
MFELPQRKWSGTLHEKELTPAERGDLLDVVQRPGYQIILDVMERAIAQQLRRTLQTPLSEKDDAEWQRVVAVAEAQFYKDVQALIGHEVYLATGGGEQARPDVARARDEFELESILR